MSKVRNANSTDQNAEKMLSDFNTLLEESRVSGKTLQVNHTRGEMLKIKENLTRRRHEIPGADSYIEYAEQVLLAEARGLVAFKE